MDFFLLFFFAFSADGSDIGRCPLGVLAVLSPREDGYSPHSVLCLCITLHEATNARGLPGMGSMRV